MSPEAMTEEIAMGVMEFPCVMVWLDGVRKMEKSGAVMSLLMVIATSIDEPLLP